MELKKYRWAKTYEAGESELINFLESKKIDAERWAGKEDEVFSPHVHPLDKKLFCAEGSITFVVNGNQSIPLQAGDALNLPANTMHEATAGFAGCVCYESPRLDENPMIEVSRN